MPIFMQNIYVPPELFDEICSVAERQSILCLMRTSKQMYTATTHNVYRTASVTGLMARRLFATLSSESPNAFLYASSVRHLTYTATNLEDAFITFQLFVHSLLKMWQLRTLELVVGKSVSSFLTVQLNKTGVNRQYRHLINVINPMAKTDASIRSLPALKSLIIRGDHKLTSLARCRQLTSVTISVPMSMSDLHEVLHNLMEGSNNINSNPHLRTLELNFYNRTTNETALAFITVARLFPCLTHLTLRIPLLNPLVSVICLQKMLHWKWTYNSQMLIDIMRDSACYFPKLRVLFVNTITEKSCGSYVVQEPRYLSPEGKCRAFFTQSLEEAGQMRPFLHRVWFGLQEWHRLVVSSNWRAITQDIAGTSCHPGRILQILYSMKCKTGNWCWITGAEEDIYALLSDAKWMSSTMHIMMYCTGCKLVVYIFCFMTGSWISLLRLDNMLRLGRAYLYFCCFRWFVPGWSLLFKLIVCWVRLYGNSYMYWE